MKYILLIFSVSFVFLSCKKQPENPIQKGPITLSGKWNYSQSFYSEGGPLIYESTKNLKQWIVFDSTGTFSGNMPEFKNAVSYEIVDSVKVKFKVPSQQPDTRLFFYNIDTSTNVLTVSPADLICIEGCGYKFER